MRKKIKLLEWLDWMETASWLSVQVLHEKDSILAKDVGEDARLKLVSDFVRRCKGN